MSINRIRKNRDDEIKKLFSEYRFKTPARDKREKSIRGKANREMEKIRKRNSKKNEEKKKKISDYWEKRLEKISKEKPSKSRDYKERRAKEAKKNNLKKQVQAYATQQKGYKKVSYVEMGKSQTSTPQPRKFQDGEIIREREASDYVATFQYWFFVPRAGTREEAIYTDFIRLTSKKDLSGGAWNNRFLRWAKQSGNSWKVDTSRSFSKSQAQPFSVGPYSQNRPDLPTEKPYLFLVLGVMKDPNVVLFDYQLLEIGKVRQVMK